MLMDQDTSRRRFLAAAAAGGALLFGRPRDAAALRIEPMDAGTARALAESCGAAGDDHLARAITLLRAEAARRGLPLTLGDANALLARTRCPLCGCAVGPLDALPDGL
ncbi:MAG: hypothetical protein AB7P02_10885 [Alphaproteobacteria bacterium]